MLEQLIASTKKRVAVAKAECSLDCLQEVVEKLPLTATFNFEDALRKKPISFICELKRASPSKGIICDDFPYLEIAKEYEAAGAAAISILTEPEYFLGNDQYLVEVKKAVNLPLLRKDFIIDEYQLYQSKIIGADAVLLISSLYTTEKLREMLTLCSRLGLSALVETHTALEIQSALAAGAKIIGVNNRDLATFKVDLHHCLELRSLVPQDILFVAESGMKTFQDVQTLAQHQVDAVLVGEALMSSADRFQALRSLGGEFLD